ncbi:MAG: hypothetical protein RQ833_07445 [Sphingomonadaceae bacterium]|nr:hypothetical protein [Sphingomonadaceae bacterium]
MNLIPNAPIGSPGWWITYLDDIVLFLLMPVGGAALWATLAWLGTKFPKRAEHDELKGRVDMTDTLLKSEVMRLSERHDGADKRLALIEVHLKDSPTRSELSKEISEVSRKVERLDGKIEGIGDKVDVLHDYLRPVVETAMRGGR